MTLRIPSPPPQKEIQSGGGGSGPIKFLELDASPAVPSLPNQQGMFTCSGRLLLDVANSIPTSTFVLCVGSETPLNISCILGEEAATATVADDKSSGGSSSTSTTTTTTTVKGRLDFYIAPSSISQEEEEADEEDGDAQMET